MAEWREMLIFAEVLDVQPKNCGIMEKIHVLVRFCVFSVVMMLSLGAYPQTPHAWEGYLDDVMTAEDMETTAWEDTYELLCEREQHPLDLNRATREELEELSFLSAQQIEDILAYLYRYGPMKSLGELMLIPSLDYSSRRLLGYFVFVNETTEEKSFPSLRDITRYGHHELMATGRIPCYERKGDSNGYQGYPYRHWLRYQFSYGDFVKAGLVGAQDAGEPFFKGKNQWGYDYYSYYLQLRNLGWLESLVLGKYRVSMGMGLILNSNFALGKVAMLQNLGRATNTIRAHSSRSAADYLQGAAATVRFHKHLTATGFVSYRAMDATLNDDGTAATILTTGYHRTQSELEKKNNLNSTTYGGQIRYQQGGFHAGLNLVGTHLDRELKPNTAVLYRRHRACGSDFLNLSADYGYVHHRFSVNGETAMNSNGALATINTLSLQLGSELSLMALQRFYSYRYTSLFARSYSDGGYVQNESGVYLGATWQPSPRWRLIAYADYAYFPWARYQVSQSSHTSDFLLQIAHLWASWNFSARYRIRLRQKDLKSEESSEPSLARLTQHYGRLRAEYDGRLSSRTQIDFSMMDFEQRDWGLMVSQSLAYQHRWLRVNGGVGYFRTDNYDSRVYLYEQGPLYTYGFSQFYGEGIRYWLMLRANLGRHLMFAAKFGTTDYFDRSSIGSSYQKIDRSSQTDIDLQVRWKF